MTDKPVRDYDKFMLRFPDGMRDAIANRAKANGRSMNSEIVQILEDALKNGADSWDVKVSESESSESVTMTLQQLNKLISIAAEEVADSFAKKIASDSGVKLKRVSKG